MAGRNTEIRVGIAVIGALALVIWGVTWLSDARLARKRRVYNVRFSDVGGLATGDPVSVNGVSMGKVQDITLRPGGVNVKFAIDRGVRITRNSNVNVRNTGLMGEKFIAVDLAMNAGLWRHPRHHPGYYETGVPEVISQMGDGSTASASPTRGGSPAISPRSAARCARRSTTWKAPLVDFRPRSPKSAGPAARRRRTGGVSGSCAAGVEQKNPVALDRGPSDYTTGRAEAPLITRLSLAADRFASLARKADSDSSTVGRLLRDQEL
jgi:hypothetical protein